MNKYKEFLNEIKTPKKKKSAVDVPEKLAKDLKAIEKQFDMKIDSIEEDPKNKGKFIIAVKKSVYDHITDNLKFSMILMRTPGVSSAYKS